MAISAEVIVTVIGVLVAAPCTAVMIWTCWRRRVKRRAAGQEPVNQRLNSYADMIVVVDETRAPPASMSPGLTFQVHWFAVERGCTIIQSNEEV